MPCVWSCSGRRQTLPQKSTTRPCQPTQPQGPSPALPRTPLPAGEGLGVRACPSALQPMSRSWKTLNRDERRSLSRRVAPLDIDVVIAPRLLVEGVVFVADEPRLNNDVLVAVGVQRPWCID